MGRSNKVYFVPLYFAVFLTYIFSIKIYPQVDMLMYVMTPTACSIQQSITAEELIPRLTLNYVIYHMISRQSMFGMSRFISKVQMDVFGDA